ncbi:MAG: hypothetical protein PVH02_14115 [Desulfobacteraceae bacterium]
MWKKEIFLILLLTLVSTTAFSFVEGNLFFLKVEGAERIAVIEARQKVVEGQAILVCAYDSDENFNKMRLQGAIPLSTFKDRLTGIEKDQMIIFYCA